MALTKRDKVAGMITVGLQRDWFVTPEDLKHWVGDKVVKYGSNPYRLHIQHKYVDLNAYVSIDEFGDYYKSNVQVKVESTDYKHKPYDRRKSSTYLIKKVFNNLTVKEKDITKFLPAIYEKMNSAKQEELRIKESERLYQEKMKAETEAHVAKTNKDYEYLDTVAPNWRGKVNSITVPSAFTTYYSINCRITVDKLPVVADVIKESKDTTKYGDMNLSGYDVTNKTVFIQAYIPLEATVKFLNSI